MRRFEKILATFLTAILVYGCFPVPVPVHAASWLDVYPEGRLSQSGDSASLTILFWNLENFFDWKNSGSGEADAEFSSRGARHWTYRRFRAKRDAIAKALLWIEGKYGSFPDIFGVAEVENAGVIKSLMHGTNLYKYPLGYVHYDSPDRRGIDVGLIYNTQRLKLLSSRPVHVDGVGPDGDSLHTRDILLATFALKGVGRTFCRSPEAGGDYLDRLTVMVCHFPSKYGGGLSGWKRLKASEVLKSCADSLRSSGENRYIAMGDFNDTPDSKELALLTADEGTFVNLSSLCVPGGEGSIRFNGKWQLIDMFFSAPEMTDAWSEVVRIPFLTARDNVHPGEKPFRTWSGPRYAGGVSDHCPIVMCVDVGVP